MIRVTGKESTTGCFIDLNHTMGRESTTMVWGDWEVAVAKGIWWRNFGSLKSAKLKFIYPVRVKGLWHVMSKVSLKIEL
jgi:hypothetical protein